MMTTYEKRLLDLYLRARKRLTKILLQKFERGQSTVHTKVLLKQVQKEIDVLTKKAKSIVKAGYRSYYLQGAAEASKLISQIQPVATFSFNTFHEREIKLTIDAWLADIENTNAYIGRRTADIIRSTTLEQLGIKQTAGQTQKQYQKELLNTFEHLNIDQIRDKRGRKMNMKWYAEMVGRTSQAEATNLGILNRAKELDQDLVYIAPYPEACPLCVPLQDRVYSISGKDKRFPPLSIAFPSIYYTIHPNCKHRLTLYIEKYDKDNEGTIRKSNRSFDVLSKKDHEALKQYHKTQEYKRKLNADRKQWESYKAILGDRSPKTLSAYRQMKRHNSEYYKYLKLDCKRRRKLIGNPDLTLPFADSPVIDSRKFTNYIFDPQNIKGYSKGVAFESRLGYNIDNWTQLHDEILKNIKTYPAKCITESPFGAKYEQKMVIYGLKGKPANVVVGWIKDGEQIRLTSAYIKEVK